MPTYFPARRYGGPIYSVHGLCKALVQDGHEVDVVTTNVDGEGTSDVALGQRVDLDGVGVRYFPTKWPRRLYRSPLMRTYLKRHLANYDVLHIHSMFLWPGMSSSRLAKKLGVSFVVSPRGMLVDELIQRKNRWLKRAWIQCFDRAMIEHAAGIHVTSIRELEDLGEFGFRLPAVINIPNGVELPADMEMSTGNADENGEDYVLFLGRVDPKKGVDVLIEAVTQVPKVRLVIAGAGDVDYVEQLKAQVQQAGMTGRVKFVGHANDEVKWTYYRNAAVFVLPSVSENFGNTVLEAMAAGCPVVVTPGVGLADAVAQYECGLVVERNPSQLGAAIEQLLKSDQLRAKMGQNGTALAREQFSWHGIATAMAAQYQRVVDGNRPADEIAHWAK